MIKYKLKIVDIVDETEGTKTYYIEKPENLTWEAGAHTHIGHVGFDSGEKPNKNWVRHMSIMTLPDENKVGITTRLSGSSSEFKNKMAKLNIGDEVVLFKLGSRMALRRCGRPVVLLSMGVGIAAVRPVILSFIRDKADVPYLVNMNVDSSGNFIFKDEFDNLSDENFENYWLNSRQAFYEKLEHLAELEKAIYYIVGSDKFIKDVIKSLKSRNVNSEDIVIDKKEEAIQEFFSA